ncbi:hypothetical protein Bp8pS_066 [Bacillus phage vB_BpuM-BpSp]|nr:hypothetical protein Bp8pS_066 [Bacillus phage vB_BpuM-BpSp]
MQLPPVSGGNTLLRNPDVFLDEILRQALDNEIIRLSMKARNGEYINFGRYGNDVVVIRNNQIEPEMFMSADQIIAGRNATISALNTYHRKKHLGINDPMPIVGDKIICLDNNWNYVLTEGNIEISLVNGSIGTIEEMSNLQRARLYNFTFKPNFMKEKAFHDVHVDKIPFMHETLQQSIKPKELYIYRKKFIDGNGINKFNYGYAITCHKSQGSEFNNVLLFNEVINKRMHPRWLYTAITRAKEKLIIVNV